MNDSLRDLPEFGAQIRRSGRTARRIVARGEIPSYRIGGQLMVRQSDIDSWINAQRIEPSGCGRPTPLKSLVAAAVARAKAKKGAA